MLCVESIILQNGIEIRLASPLAPDPSCPCMGCSWFSSILFVNLHLYQMIRLIIVSDVLSYERWYSHIYLCQFNMDCLLRNLLPRHGTDFLVQN